MSSVRPEHGGDRDPITVVMTGAGAPGASGIVRSLRGAPDREVEVVGVDMDANAYGFALVDDHDVVPPGDDPEFVEELAAVVDRVDADVVLPLVTAELQPLAENRDRIDATVMVSEAERLAVANDKAALYGFLGDEGFASAPEFRLVESREAFVDAVGALGYPDEPVCFKPPVGSGSRGFRVLDERGDDLQRFLEEKPDVATTTLDDVLPVLDSGDSFPALAVMEYLPGEEYSVDVLATDDGAHAVVPRSRSRTRAGISFEGTIERREDLIEEAAAICEGLGLEYNVNLQFKYAADGTPKVIEINPRVSGTIVLCVGAGANLPYLAVTHALDEPLPEVDVAWGTSMVRYWDEVFTSPDGDRYHVDPPAFRRTNGEVFDETPSR
ncbi:ATP-grasp domain-containing protein [Halorubellus sp. JP-L1]|uniref:ATP-grasp domain-containing protein n=1 Tax=Halorubellus sp. JP-L1 TaxID=2715753 RepID=UPI0014080D41|nr:ATP-grasp domain-containing protein [Halorubellus sp. JP-L1]NHN43175.1 ATP-grasp domain-containing protein [Halorubellus sp. JP-L1]